MKKAFLIVLTAFIVVGCKSMKKTTDSSKTDQETTVERRTVTRPGDTISIDVPKFNFKDTTIVRTNYETRTQARIIYDDQGNARVECLSAELKEEMELIRQAIKSETESTEEKKTEFTPQHFIYALAALGVVLIVLIFMIMKVQKSIPGTVAKIIKETAA